MYFISLHFNIKFRPTDSEWEPEDFTQKPFPLISFHKGSNNYITSLLGHFRDGMIGLVSEGALGSGETNTFFTVCGV